MVLGGGQPGDLGVSELRSAEVTLTDRLSKLQVQALVRVYDPSKSVRHSLVQVLDLVALGRREVDLV